MKPSGPLRHALERYAAPVSAPWMPIRSLTAQNGDQISSHLIALSESDRYLRFGFSATDEQVIRYTESLQFDRDEVFGIFNPTLELIAMAHLACFPIVDEPEASATAEFGVSVAGSVRGQRYGTRLFEHAVLHASNRGCERLFIHALSENTVMLKIARNGGATVECNGSESQAWLKLSPHNLSSQRQAPLTERLTESRF